jgi:hypothetical protein
MLDVRCSMLDVHLSCRARERSSSHVLVKVDVFDWAGLLPWTSHSGAAEGGGAGLGSQAMAHIAGVGT